MGILNLLHIICLILSIVTGLIKYLYSIYRVIIISRKFCVTLQNNYLFNIVVMFSIFRSMHGVDRREIK